MYVGTLVHYEQTVGERVVAALLAGFYKADLQTCEAGAYTRPLLSST